MDEAAKTQQRANGKNEERADFERAMEASGFGLFNYLIIATSIPTAFATVFESSTMSYILPVAECDLKLSLLDKGTLNAITYGGMIVSALIWGYLADTQGRRKVLVFGLFADCICVFLSSLSQNFPMLVALKFLGGFVTNGPGAVKYTYITEFHGQNNRSLVVMVIGVLNSLANLALPLLAWAILPRPWDFVLFGYLKVHSWQIFLAFSGLPSLIAAVMFLLLPETPKFLMSKGRNAEALLVFQRIYAMNKQKPKDTFPIFRLVEEVPSNELTSPDEVYTIEPNNGTKATERPKRGFYQALKDGTQQMKPLFRKPLLGHAMHVCTLQFCILLGMNTIRLWLPQLFASISEYESLHARREESASLCEILEYSVNKTSVIIEQSAEECSIQPVSIDMYTNNMAVSVVNLVGYMFAGAIIRAIGGKRLLYLGLFISTCLGLGLYWSTSSLTTLIISSLFITVTTVSSSGLLGVVVTIFPTSLRALITSSTMMFGRLGSLTGNLLFPIFMKLGCLPPFLMVSSFVFCASALSSLLPSAEQTTFT